MEAKYESSADYFEKRSPGAIENLSIDQFVRSNNFMSVMTIRS